MNLSKRDEKILDFLWRQAVDVEPVKSSKIAAAVVVKGKIISTGYNRMKTHPFQAQYSKNNDAIFLHAETSAICNALNHLKPEELSKATLYVQRVKRGNHKPEWVSGLAKPCPGCARCIAEFDIKRVVYSTETEEYEVL